MPRASERPAPANEPKPPPGIMSKEEMEAHEQRPLPKSYAEQMAEMAEGDRYIASYKYHQGLR
jgi:hypothetical protein